MLIKVEININMVTTCEDIVITGIALHEKIKNLGTDATLLRKIDDKPIDFGIRQSFDSKRMPSFAQWSMRDQTNN